MPAKSLKSLLAVVVAAGCLTAVPAVASAATITVDTTSDGANTSTDNAACESGKTGCTLRAAVQMANATTGLDTIIVPDLGAPYTLTISGADSVDPAATGDLDLTDDVTITGDGASTTTIDASAIKNRIFDVHGETAATISGLLMENGIAPSDDVVDSNDNIVGGGIRVLGALTLMDATLSYDNAQDYGGGAATDAPGATMTLQRVLVDHNGSSGGPIGGGIAQVTGNVAIDHSTITNNAAFWGGGVAQDAGSGADGVMTITDSLIADNIASPYTTTTTTAPVRGITLSVGGGVLEDGGGAVTLTRTEVRDNSANQGGGVAEDGGGTIGVVDSWVHDNFAGGFSPYTGAGGGLLASMGSLDVTRSTVNANHADQEGGGLLEQYGGAVTMTNSTLTDNDAQSGGGISLEGAGIGGPGTLSLESSTIDANKRFTPQIVFSPTRGVSVSVIQLDNCATTQRCSVANEDTPATVTSHATIVAGTGPDCGGPITSNGVNLSGDDTCSFHAAGDKVNTDPGLGPLASNGGPTMTMALLSGSPAIDAAGTAGCPATDQRGVTRPQGPACDIGAYEVVVPPPAAKPAVPPLVVVAPSVAPKTPARCASRRHFRIRIRKRHGIRIVSATVRVNGKKVTVLRGARLKAPVDLRRLPRGTFTVSIAARTSRGRVLRAHRTYHTCIPRLPAHRLPAL